jgi:hypothetical protein
MEERLQRASLWVEKSQMPVNSAPMTPTDAQPLLSTPISEVANEVSTQAVNMPLAAQSITPSADSIASSTHSSQATTIQNITGPNPQLSSPIPQTLNPTQPSLVIPQTIPNLGFTPTQPSLIIPQTLPNATQPSLAIPQTILNSGFTPNPIQAFSSTPQYSFDANLGGGPTALFGTGPQHSFLTELMSEPLYTWPNQQGHGYSADRDLFDFSGLQYHSGTNNFFNVNVPTQANPYINTAAIPQNVNASANVNAPANVNTPANVNAQANVNVPTIINPVANHYNNTAENVHSPANVDMPSHINVPTHVNHVFNVDIPADTITPGNVNLDLANTSANDINQGTAKKPRKRKSDNVDLVLPDGSRRVRKQKTRPDEHFPLSTTLSTTKKGKKKESGRKK